MASKRVHIEETDTEFVLSLPYDQRQRAKSIEGYRWEPERKSWVFPRTRRVYEALIAEFGDDLVTLTITRPQVPNSAAQTATLQTENQSLKDELADIRNTLQLISQANQQGTSSEARALQSALAARENELATLRGQLQEREREVARCGQQLAESHQEVERLRTATTALQAELHKRQGSRATPSASVEALLKQKAQEATGNDPIFVEMIGQLKMDATFPIELGKYLERKLRVLLDCTDRSLTLHDLITQAKDAAFLPEEAIDLAHIIRKQRNIMAHERLDARTHGGRILFSLFAASILWPQLPE
jgi:DNA repair exonuclease SbcCD ATPase subunit